MMEGLKVSAYRAKSGRRRPDDHHENENDREHAKRILLADRRLSGDAFLTPPPS
jgi:hypothetical protein